MFFFFFFLRNKHILLSGVVVWFCVRRLFTLRGSTSHKLNARWARSIIKPTQEKRACHKVKIHPKEVKHLAHAWIQEEAQDAIQHGWRLLGKKLLQSSDEVSVSQKKYKSACKARPRSPLHVRAFEINMNSLFWLY